MKKIPLTASLLLSLFLFATPAAACPGGDDKDPDEPDAPSFCPGGDDKDPDEPSGPSLF